MRSEYQQVCPRGSRIQDEGEGNVEEVKAFTGESKEYSGQDNEHPWINVYWSDMQWVKL